MLYLLIAIVCGTLFSVIFKLCSQRGISTLWAILFNYVTAALVSWVPLFWHHMSGGPAPVNPLTQNWIWLALLQGVLFMGGFSVMSGSTKVCGVALTNVAARSSLIVPVILSWLFLSQPAPAWLPVVLVIAALVIIAMGNRSGDATAVPNPDGTKEKVNIFQRPRFIMMLVFLFYGVSDFSLKLVQNTVSAQCGSDAELLDRSLSALSGTIFVMAALVSLIVAVSRPKDKRPEYSWKGVGFGVLLGLANVGCTGCMLRSLTVLSTGTFYPLYNIGIVLFGTLAGLLFKEKLRPLQLVGFALAILAIVLFFI